MTKPTVLYGMYFLTGKFDRDLAFHNFPQAPSPPKTPTTPTYSRASPPGPSPTPARRPSRRPCKPQVGCKDLFFVAKGDGTHTFCPDLQCHEKAVAQYVSTLHTKH